MALLEVHQGHCSQCGHDLLVQVWWPRETALQRLGSLQGLSADDAAAILEAAHQADEWEREDLGAFLLDGAMFVDGSQERAILCPECGGLLCILARQRAG